MNPTYATPGADRARACLCGLAAIAMLWAVSFGAAVAAAAQEPRHWDREVAGTLLAYIEHIDRHGLDPADYDPASLERAIGSDDSQALERQATRTFGEVAMDLAIGHVRPGRRGRYYIQPNTLAPSDVALLIDRAIEARSVTHVLEALAPQNREYDALRAALAGLEPGASEQRRKLEASLERWRWLPRALGERHVFINIPEYRLRLMDRGGEASSHSVIVGKTSTPTPQFSASVTAVILNPSWHVPQSIVAESVGRLVRNSPATARARGYTWSYAGGGLRVTQQPGPQNALGQMKLEMANPLTVYVHDTPSKDLFEREERTFSHGCIRTQNPLDLAAALLADAGWGRTEIDQAVAGRRTQRVALAAAVPIYVVYMTAIARPDGSVSYLDDPYRLDAAIAGELGG